MGPWGPWAHGPLGLCAHGLKGPQQKGNPKGTYTRSQIESHLFLALNLPGKIFNTYEMLGKKAEVAVVADGAADAENQGGGKAVNRHETPRR